MGLYRHFREVKDAKQCKASVWKGVRQGAYLPARTFALKGLQALFAVHLLETAIEPCFFDLKRLNQLISCSDVELWNFQPKRYNPCWERIIQSN